MDRWSKFWRSPWILYLGLASPLALVFVPILQQEIAYLADPVKFLLEFIGKAAVILFIVTLSVTPLRRLFPKSAFVKALAYRRRQIGVSVFVYALLHFLLYLPYIGSLEALLDDWDKLFILSGLVALLLLLVLAGTSNNFSVKRLGGKKWKRLHLLVYPTLALVIYHQAAQEKTGFRETAVYFAPLVVLESIRVLKATRKRLGKPVDR